MPATFAAIGANNTNTGTSDRTPTLPAGDETNQVVIDTVTVNRNATASPPTSYAQAVAVTGTSPTLRAHWIRYGSDVSGTVTTPHGGDVSSTSDAVLMRTAGAIQSGTPIGATASIATAAANTSTAVDLNGCRAGSLLVFIVSLNNSRTITSPPSGFTQRTTGALRLHVFTQEISSAGNYTGLATSWDSTAVASSVVAFEVYGGFTGAANGTVATVGLTASGSVSADYTGGGSRTETVTLTGSGQTNVFGGASLGVVATRTVVGAGAGVAEGIETVQLVSGGHADTYSESERTAVAGLSGGGVVGAVGGAGGSVDVAFDAAGSPGANAAYTATVGLTAAGGGGGNAARTMAVGLSADAAVAATLEGEAAIGVGLSASGSRNTYSGAELHVSVERPAPSYIRQRWFEPPTQDQAMPDDVLWSRFDTPVGISVVKQGGHFVNVPTPTHDEFAAAGVEGVDWFRGGYRYDVTDDAAWAQLAEDGYVVADLVVDEGYGFGPYGSGPYGG